MVQREDCDGCTDGDHLRHVTAWQKDTMSEWRACNCTGDCDQRRLLREQAEENRVLTNRQRELDRAVFVLRREHYLVMPPDSDKIRAEFAKFGGSVATNLTTREPATESQEV